MPIRGGIDVTAQQADIVDSVKTSKVTVVSAGAGTGKTHTTVATVLELLETNRPHLGLDQFVLITFTNKAADEMRKRLEAALRDRIAKAAAPADRRFWQEQNERLASAFLGTIHGYCSQVIRLFGYQERVAREVDVTLSTSPLRQAIEEAVEAAQANGTALLGLQVDWTEYELRDRLLDVLKYLYNRGMTGAQLRQATAAQPADAGKPYRETFAELVRDAERRYEALKAEQHMIDQNDLLALTAQMLTSSYGSTVADKVGSRYRYMFVDEFQDTDPVQMQVIERLLPKLAGILVVGDAKQSIFRFRGAVETLLREIARRHNVPVLPLTVSRRPTKPLLDVQNALFGNMAVYRLNDPLLEDPQIARPAGDPPPFAFTLAPAAGYNAEVSDRIRVTAERITRLIGQNFYDTKEKTVRPIEPGDIAVLLRSNTHLQQYAVELGRLTGERVQAEAGGLFFQRPEIVSTYRMLLLILHYPDDAVLSLALDTPYLSDVDSARKQQEVIQYDQQGSPLTDWFEEDYPIHAAKLGDFRQAVLDHSVPHLLGRLYEEFGVREYFRQRGDQQAVENLEKLRELSRRLVSVEQALTLSQFAGYLESAILAGFEEKEALVDLGEEEKRPDHVRVMTIHRSKGLEFPVVLVPEMQAKLVGVEPPEFVVDGDGLEIRIPLTSGLETRTNRFTGKWQAEQRQQLEETMRIFYVAVTRARNVVVCIGSGSPVPKQRWAQFFAWKDEVLMVKTQLRGLGAHY